MKLLKIIAIVLIVNITTITLVLYYIDSNEFINEQVKKQWDKEAKLYVQGYLDGKQDVLDSLSHTLKNN